ncbi:trypsin-like peptidase domain-containing protein [Azospirillum sp. HJ39]|uniref:trypsin-like serine peptidase n=1 Tax=Azospirillum sp. HJ39 TaxID=3159496 RepID=UPI003558CBDD
MNKRPKEPRKTREENNSDLIFSPIEDRRILADTAAPPPTTFAAPGLEGFGDRLVPGFLSETYGGGELESVPGFNAKRALTEGLNGMEGLPQDDGAPGEQQSRRETVYFDPDDNRARISDTARIPWRCICQLYVTRQTGKVTIGTGWFAAPDLVVTAGHNYLDPENGGLATSIVVTAGNDGTSRPPFPPVAPASVYINHRWESDSDPSYDYAFLRLTDGHVVGRTGYFPFGEAKDDFLNGVLVNTAGYPVDKPLGTMWFSAGRVFRQSPTQLSHRIDTEGGFSGAPLIYKNGDRHIVLGMHTQGDPTVNRSRFNSGLRVSGAFFDELRQATGR